MRKVKHYTFLVTIISVLVLLISFSVLSVSASEERDIQITATANESVKQGEDGTCYVYIDSLEKLSSLIVTVHYDPNKVHVAEGNVKSVAPSLLYDRKVIKDNVQFSYIFDGNGNKAKAQLFYFKYTVLATSDIGDTFFDIVVSEAFDSDLAAISVVGSRCNFSVLLNPNIVSHSYTRQVIEDAYRKSEATCKVPAIYYYCCEDCDAKSEATFEYGDALGHNYKETLSYNELSHWQECSRCGEKTDSVSHSSAQFCVICGYINTSSPSHTHRYSSSWSSDANNHWHSCLGCSSVKDKSTHSYINDYDTNCDVCGYVITSKTTEWNNPFEDVKRADWYFEAIRYVNTNKFMNGTSVSTFAPNEKLTRAMFVTVLYRLEKEPSVKSDIAFNDVKENAWYTNAVIWAKEYGIVNGLSRTEFAPDANITREQIATIIYRYSQYKGYDVNIEESTNILSYDDAGSISEYAVSAMQYAVGSGLINGKTATTLNPQDNATRAEIAVVLQRFIEGKRK